MKARLLGARYFQIVVLTVLAGILYLGAHFFVETFRINRVWMERVEIPSALAFDANTFDFLSAGGAIWPVRDGVSVSLGHAPATRWRCARPKPSPWSPARPGKTAANTSANCVNRRKANGSARRSRISTRATGSLRFRTTARPPAP
jgi:hypothetical protein